MKTLLFNDLPFVFPILFLIMVAILMYYPNALVIVTCIIILLWFISIFRVEERTSDNISNRHILSPIDGTLLEIREHDDSFTFVFFNSIFNAQTQWAPYAGKISNVSNIDGDKDIAWSLEHHNDNKQDIISIETDIGSMELHKILSWMTLKERNFINVGETVDQTQLLGYIIFPARIDLTIPKSNITPVLHPNEKVVGGKTIIAKLK
jgi:phosphatidylserine decarboxylase